MSTDQINLADLAAGTRRDSPDSDTAAARAAQESRQIVAKARYEAFRMVTEARGDAESLLDDARTEADELVSAVEANDTIAAENADLTAVNAALRVEYNELVDLIDSSQKLVGELDIRLLDLATMPDTPVPRGSASPSEVGVGIDASPAPIVFDYSPAVAPPPKPSRAITTQRAESFYARNSAKLPRIGDEAGKEALAVIRSMRERLREADSR